MNEPTPEFDEHMPEPTRRPDINDAALVQERARWGRSWVEIDLGALRRNAARLSARLTPSHPLIFSVKKDGYGHGLTQVAGAFADFPALGGFGIATVEEGIALRQAGFNQTIICFSVMEGDALEEAIRQDLTLSVTRLEDALSADQAARKLGRPAHAHLKIDTGMGRLGLLGEEACRDIGRMMALENLQIDSLYSHLADAWEDPASGTGQIRRMEDFLQKAHLESMPCHWGGADAIRVLNQLQASGPVRLGIALYGDHPALADLEPAMTFKSRVIYRRRVPEGTKISYGGTFRTTRPTELALVGAGYGNGLPRALSGKGQVLIRGRRCPILGRVCMDQVVVDVTEWPDITTGEEAVIFGRQGEACLPAREVASVAGTISYELFCIAGQVNPRRYMDA